MRLQIPKNSACCPSSIQSFGAGVAVRASLNGVSRKRSHISRNVAPSSPFNIELSSARTPANRSGSNFAIRS